MSVDHTAQKPLICPACFAREIDPVFLHFDPAEDGEYYCQHCGYTAATREEVIAFQDEFILRRHGIHRKSRSTTDV